MQFQPAKLFFFFQQFEFERKNNRLQLPRHLQKNLFRLQTYCCCIWMHHKICISGWSMSRLKFILTNLKSVIFNCIRGDSDFTVFSNIPLAENDIKHEIKSPIRAQICRLDKNFFNSSNSARCRLSNILLIFKSEITTETDMVFRVDMLHNGCSIPITDEEKGSNDLLFKSLNSCSLVIYNRIQFFYFRIFYTNITMIFTKYIN